MSLPPFAAAAQGRLGGGVPPSSQPSGPPAPTTGAQPQSGPTDPAQLSQLAAQGLGQANDALMQILDSGAQPDPAMIQPELQALGQTLSLLSAQAQQGAPQGPNQGGPGMPPGGAAPAGPLPPMGGGY